MTSTTAGTMDGCSWKLRAVAEQVEWAREAAKGRADEIELHILVHRVDVTDDRRGGAERMLEWSASFPPSVLTPCEMGADDVLESPHALIGTVDQIVETLRARREQLGISYISVFGQEVNAFAPVVARLAGT